VIAESHLHRLWLKKCIYHFIYRGKHRENWNLKKRKEKKIPRKTNVLEVLYYFSISIPLLRNVKKVELSKKSEKNSME
jgi:hypothetical protein